MEKTLILLKPDCVSRGHCGEVIGRFEQAGFKIRACKMMQLGDGVLKEHYAHIAHLPFFPEIQAFMKSTPVIAMVWEGDGIVDKVRAMLGPTDSKKAPMGSIRADLGQSVMMNIAHASDSVDSATAEIRRFFGSDGMFSY